MSKKKSQTTDDVFTASANGDLKKLRKFVERDGASLSSPDNDGFYALQWAALNNHPLIVEYIVKHGGDVNAVNENQYRRTALHYAAMTGAISAADALLQNGAQVEAAELKGRRAVHIAAQYGQRSFLNHIVVKYDADFDVPDNSGKMPLHWAADCNQPEIVQYLIKHGGDVNAVDNDRPTALHYAAKTGSISAADALLQNGAQVEAAELKGKRRGGDVNAVDNDRKTALHYAAMIGSIVVADVLLLNGAHVEAADLKGDRAMHFAANYGQTSFLYHIVDKHNADIDAPNNTRLSPLHLAAHKGYGRIVKCLLSKGASKKRQDMLGRTPLHYAALQKDLNGSMVLMEASNKEDIMVKDGEGNTAIQLASSILQPYMLAKALHAECKHLPNSNFKENPVVEGITRGDGNKNWSMIIAVQGNAYTGKTVMSSLLAVALNCPFISLDAILDVSEPTNEKDTLISNTFNTIAQIAKSNIQLGFSVVIDSPLSRLSHLQKLVDLVSAETPFNTQLVIIECKPKNEYAYQLRFEEMDPTIYNSRWHKPAAVWPLPKVPRDYTDDDIPHGVSKLVVDTHDNLVIGNILEAIFDITLCGYGHRSNYSDKWKFVHEDKKELFTYFFPYFSKCEVTPARFHDLRFEMWVDCDNLCGVCDNQVHDSHYICKDCPLVLHKSCAELARGEKKHFVPETFPIFLPSEPHFRFTFPVERPCAECRNGGSGFSCKCTRCLFESHLKSRLLPTVVKHKGDDDVLIFNLSLDGPNGRGTVCKACRKEVGYATYFSASFEYLYHLECALLPPLIHHHSHGGYMHDLEMITRRVEKMEDYLCDCCLTKMDPTMWYYYCGECNISMHMECAFLDFDTGGPIIEARS